jgi:hypothetical protein
MKANAFSFHDIAKGMLKALLVAPRTNAGACDLCPGKTAKVFGLHKFTAGNRTNSSAVAEVEGDAGLARKD